jgi:hypothetical protein
VSLAQQVMASMASDCGHGGVEGSRGEEGIAHQSPKCLPGWHGEAVPARSTRGYPGKTSPAAKAARGATPPGLLRPTLARPPAASRQLTTPERASATVARLKLGQVPEP